jgi:hypothetical protein
MTHEESGVDTARGWQKVVNEGRERWRLIQLASAVRDCPEEAAPVLREFEYNVDRSASGSGRGGRPDEAKMGATPHRQREGRSALVDLISARQARGEQE